jgi:outer membrane protein TolC
MEFPDMNNRLRTVLLAAAVSAGYLGGIGLEKLTAQEAAPPAVQRLTLEEIKQRVLANNKLLQLAARNVQSKEYATKAVQANYFPQIIGQSVYFYFNDNLGTVLSTSGRVVRGPRGTPLKVFPPNVINIPLLDQNTNYSTINAIQPITDLLKVRQGVKIGRADEGIAQAQMEKGTRELLSGVEQLFWGILAAQRIHAGTLVALARAEEVAKTGLPLAQKTLVQSRQALQEVSNQIADLEEQLTILLELPTCTKIELVEPPLPLAPVRCAEEVVTLALQSSPEIHEATETIHKAEAAVAAGKLEYVPSIAVVGGYLNNNFTDTVQTNIGYVGVIGSYTFVDWGKRRNTVRERQELVAMANLKLRQTEDDVRQKALKAFREYEQSREALKLADELVEADTAVVKEATAPADKLKTSKDLLEAKVDAVKADLAHRIAYVKLMSLIGK